MYATMHDETREVILWAGHVAARFIRRLLSLSVADAAESWNFEETLSLEEAKQLLGVTDVQTDTPKSTEGDK